MGFLGEEDDGEGESDEEKASDGGNSSSGSPGSDSDADPGLDPSESPKKRRRTKEGKEANVKKEVKEEAAEEGAAVKPARARRRQAKDKAKVAAKKKVKKEADGRGRPKSTGTKRELLRRQKREFEAQDAEVWKKEGYDGQRTKNVAYSAEEDAKILAGFKAFCHERGLNEELLAHQIIDEGVQKKSRTWGRIAARAGCKKRSVQSISLRMRKLFHGKYGRWDEQLTKRLIAEVQQSDGRPRWKEIASRLGPSPRQCKDKWKTECGKGTNGYKKWSQMEEQTLRLALVEVTGELAPTRDIPWDKVRRWLSHRSADNCRDKWYYTMLPKLLEYETKEGRAAEPELFLRHITRKIKKLRFEDLDEVQWQLVNPFWSANLNRARWMRLLARLPTTLTPVEDNDFSEIVEWLYEALDCKGQKRVDKKILKTVVLTAEREAAELSDDE